MTDEAFHYLTVFDKVHCDWYAVTTRKPCKLIPAWADKATGQRLCYVHAGQRFRQLKEDHDASTVRTRI